MKDFIVPGEVVYDQPRRFDGSFVDREKTFASVLSVKYDDRVVALKGLYTPVVSDYVIGIIKHELFSGYKVDLNSPYIGMLSSRDLRERFEVGQVISVVIRMADEVKEAELVEPRRLWGGRVIEIPAVKIPRVIGRNNSMVSLLEQYTGCRIFVGKNGRVYVKGDNTSLAIESVMKIAREAHMHGLTDRIKSFLEDETKAGHLASEIGSPFQASPSPETK
ncbi:hypothetical protein KJ765_05175 [Candidatus Micrarchaeota archaeon]|nr:hypothetical protein [Candidatus Micrarchaeota archaeon]